MMSTNDIVRLARQVAVRAAANETEPYHPASTEEVQGWERFPFPNIGNYDVPGWERVDYCQVDKSGRGDGFSKGIQELKDWCASILAVDPAAGFAIIEEGQFQAVVGHFSPNPDHEGETIAADYCWNCGSAVEQGEDECPFCYQPLEWTADGECYEPDRCEKHNEFLTDGKCETCEFEAAELADIRADWEQRTPAWQAGYLAAGQDWQPEDANPHTPGSSDYLDWAAGWNEAFATPTHLLTDPANF